MATAPFQQSSAVSAVAIPVMVSLLVRNCTGGLDFRDCFCEDKRQTSRARYALPRRSAGVFERACCLPQGKTMANQLLSQTALREKFDLYLNAAERTQLEIKAAQAMLPMSTFLRRVALRQKISAPVPEANIHQYAALARIGSNLNQLTAAVNAGRVNNVDVKVLEDLSRELKGLRLQLLGATGDEPAAKGGAQ